MVWNKKAIFDYIVLARCAWDAHGARNAILSPLNRTSNIGTVSKSRNRELQSAPGVSGRSLWETAETRGATEEFRPRVSE
jgi:hypothetical protein